MIKDLQENQIEHFYKKILSECEQQWSLQQYMKQLKMEYPVYQKLIQEWKANIKSLIVSHGKQSYSKHQKYFEESSTAKRRRDALESASDEDSAELPIERLSEVKRKQQKLLDEQEARRLAVQSGTLDAPGLFEDANQDASLTRKEAQLLEKAELLENNFDLSSGDLGDVEEYIIKEQEYDQIDNIILAKFVNIRQTKKSKNKKVYIKLRDVWLKYEGKDHIFKELDCCLTEKLE